MPLGRSVLATDGLVLGGGRHRWPGSPQCLQVGQCGFSDIAGNLSRPASVSVSREGPAHPTSAMGCITGDLDVQETPGQVTISVIEIFQTVDEGSRYNLRNVTNFSNWPEWLKVLVLVPHGILASVACWLWWPKSEKGWRRFGFAVAYLLLFYVVMRYVFQMKDFK